MKKILLEFNSNECFDSDYDFIQEKYIIFECGKYFLVKEVYLEHYKNHSTRMHHCEKTEIPVSLGKLAEKYIKFYDEKKQ